MSVRRKKVTTEMSTIEAMNPALRWCLTCCTQHTVQERCPGQVPATGAERHGWRVNVDTPHGVEAYGVLVAPSEQIWRARILTYPNVLWLVPGGRSTLKFIADSPQAVERQAADFVRKHCKERGYKIRPGSTVAIPERFDSEATYGTARTEPAGAARKVRFLPIRFGVARASEIGGTGNLSESGLFIITESPLATGAELSLRLPLESKTVQMRGSVVWMRKDHHVGRSPGMGVHLVEPPEAYVDYVRRLY